MIPAEPLTPRTVTVTGTGRVTAAPDIVELRLGVAVTRPTASAAATDAATAMTAVLGALRAAGAAGEDLRTEGLTLAPVHDYRGEGAPTLRGYELRNAVVARLRDLARLPEAIDGAIAAGATTLDAVRFAVEDRAAADMEARSAAVGDALAKAVGLAVAAGRTVGEVLTIREAPPASGPVPVVRAARMMAAEAAPTPVEAGEAEIAVTVELVASLA